MDNPIHRDWMYNRMLGRDFNPAWLVGVNYLLEFEKSQRDYLESRQIRCPCRKCKNMRYANPEQVYSDFLRNGFVADYWCWTCHGEEENDNLNNNKNGASSNVVYDAMRGGNFDCNVGDTSAQRPLYEGCNTYTELSLALQLIFSLRKIDLSLIFNVCLSQQMTKLMSELFLRLRDFASQE
ncbi:hypothetical protein ACJIZ3_019952 [Penstemon smallii]|uniref:Transposase-associated domain-containing protein n=1 Tax=Penstemon smallii TaxID=265156 RepID=A0ABD3T372_9LAMI